MKFDDNIYKYIVFEKNDHTRKIYNSLSSYEKKFVIWKNSIKHYRKFLDADLFFVSSNFLDISPDKLFFKPMSMRLKKPFINLQNGVCGIKVPYELGISYDNNILRFLPYNNEIKNSLKSDNGFKDYQLYFNKYQPKYGDLVRKKTTSNQILWFLSSREYVKDDPLHAKSLSLIVKRVITDECLKEFLKKNNLILKICSDVFLDENVYREIKNIDREICIVKQEEIDLNMEIAKSNLLITDYSYLIYDFSFLDKDYIIFQPDRRKTTRKEKLYTDDDFIIKKPSELIRKIVSEKYDKYPYIENTKPKDIDFEYLKSDKHLDEYYEYFKNLQQNQITFIGYNFYGIGGTVNATMALAEGLLKKGYYVNVLSLNKLTEIKHIPPNGLNMQYIQWNESGSIKDRFLRKFYKSPKNYSHLEFDYVKKNLHPYVGHELDRLMKRIKTNTLVSTRESLHLFLNDCKSSNVKNKIYMFHAPTEIIKVNFPNLMDKLKETPIDKAVFISDENRLDIKDNFKYDNYRNYINLGNTLIESRIIKKDEIKSISKKDKYQAIYLLRISKNRKPDIDNLINFGRYIKKHSIKHIEIDVYGDGDYIDEFLDLIEKYGLEDIIHYKMSTEEPILEIRKHDLMIDFSLNHSFGMVYIEAVLNGKKVFCMENPGSLEVMNDIPDSYIKSYEWLCRQIFELDKISSEELKSNYDKIHEKYSQEVIADKFIDFVEGKNE